MTLAATEPLARFMVIGAQKSGTTSLARQLDAHPEICLSDEKEPQYFNEVDDWRAGLEDYHANWRPTPGSICGEASTTYTFLPEFLGTHRRVHEYNPDVRLVYVMRHPVERMISNYAHRAGRGIARRPIEQDLRLDATYVNRSRYGMQLRPWMELFGPEQILLVTFEEHLQDPATSLARIARHIGADPARFPPPDHTVRHRSTGSRLNETGKSLRENPVVRRLLPHVPAAVRSRLGQRFRITLTEKPTVGEDLREALWDLVADDVAQVEAWLGRPVDEWRRPVATAAPVPGA